MNRNCLSYWFPKLHAASVPVPRTLIVRTECELISLLDGVRPPGFDAFLEQCRDAATAIGLPCFLRTGQASGKHEWSRTCHLTNIDSLGQHIAALVNWSECVDFVGLPYDVWCFREMLPVKPIAHLPAYEGMPLVREVRCFVAGGKIQCMHPYWPRGAIEEGFRRQPLPSDIEQIVAKAHTLTLGEDFTVKALALHVAQTFADDGAWSVDLLETDRGWFCTDMAEAQRSYHWEDCPNNPHKGKA